MSVSRYQKLIIYFFLSRFKYDDEQQQVVKTLTFVDPEDLPKMVVGSLMTDLLHRVVNVAQCNKMLRKGGYSPHHGDASDSGNYLF